MKSKTKATARFTPGPWFIGTPYSDVEGYREIPIHASVSTAYPVTPASVVLQFPTIPGMQDANARLIAAAPDLYALLAELLSYAKDAPPELQKRAAQALAGIEGGR